MDFSTLAKLSRFKDIVKTLLKYGLDEAVQRLNFPGLSAELSRASVSSLQRPANRWSSCDLTGSRNVVRAVSGEAKSRWQKISTSH